MRRVYDIIIINVIRVYIIQEARSGISLYILTVDRIQVTNIVMRTPTCKIYEKQRKILQCIPFIGKSVTTKYWFYNYVFISKVPEHLQHQQGHLDHIIFGVANFLIDIQSSFSALLRWPQTSNTIIQCVKGSPKFKYKFSIKKG